MSRCNFCRAWLRWYDNSNDAEKAKVGAGTIYRYFENKEALVNSLFSKSMLELSEIIKRIFLLKQIFVNSLVIRTTVYLNLRETM